jgi:tetratricopeptide (TPR) repeat protein
VSELHDKHDDEPKGTVANVKTEPETTSAQDALSQLMGSGPAPAQAPKPSQKPAPDLERDALRAAEAALAEGVRAIEEAEEVLRKEPAPAPAKKPAAPKTAVPISRTRELVLRSLIGVNIVAMIVLVLLPSNATQHGTQPANTAPHGSAAPAPAHEPVVQKPSLRDPVLRAFALAESRDYQGAITLLEQHLADSPRLDAGKKANVLLALEHYASQVGDFQKAQEFQRRMDALRSSHSLPEDLVQMALEAKRNGDIESMRRHYARLLLQQRQVPSSLYRHVAEAYLELGDSYRTEAEKGDAAARERELEQVREQLRKRAMESEPTKATDGGHK